MAKGTTTFRYDTWTRHTKTDAHVGAVHVIGTEVTRNQANQKLERAFDNLQRQLRAKAVLRVLLLLHNIRLHRPLAHFAEDMGLLRVLQTPNVDMATGRVTHQSWRFVNEILAVASGAFARCPARFLTRDHRQGCSESG